MPQKYQYHISPRTKNGGSYRVLERRLRLGRRSVGKLQARRSDVSRKMAGWIDWNWMLGLVLNQGSIDVA